MSPYHMYNNVLNPAFSFVAFSGPNPLFGQGGLSNTSAYSNDYESRIPVVENMRKQENLFQASRKWEEESGDISIDDLESLKTKFLGEEVIGIITMEDVMEELLQEEILDETDLNVHNKTRMNFVPWKRSPSSPGMASVSQIQWRTPATSSCPSYYNTPILHSPISPYVASPVIRPVLYASPGNPSPSGSVCTVRSSPSSQQVCQIQRFAFLPLLGANCAGPPIAGRHRN